LEREQYEQACPKLEQSHRLDPALGTLLLLAFCHEKVGRTASAYAEYTRAVALAERAGDTEKAAQSRSWAEALLPRLSTVQLEVDDPAPGMRIRLAGSVVNQTQWGTRVVVDPGTQLLRAEAPRRKAYEIRVSVPRNGTVAVRVPSLEPALGLPDSDTPPSSVGFWQSPTPGLIAAGVGVVGVGVGSFFGLRAVSRNSESNAFCDDANRCSDRGLALRDQALSDARISTVSMAVGVVGLAAGAVLLWPHVTGRTSVAPGSARVDLALAF
jgi:serine/threonine-protein kinase